MRTRLTAAVTTVSTLALLAAGAAGATSAAPGAATPAADRAPVARNDAYTLPEDARLLVRAPGLRANDRDPQGDRLRLRMVRGPQHGRARLSEAGRLRYVPERDWSGTDTLVYVARDPDGHRDRATVRLTVTPVNDAPSMSLKAQTPVNEGSTSRITLTASDPEGDPLTYRFDCDGDGAFEVGPTSDPVHECDYDDEGDQVVGGRVVDSHGARVTARLPIQVRNVVPRGQAPDDQTASEGEPALVDLGSFTDPGDDGPWQVVVDWGDGTQDSFVAPAPGELGQRSHTWPASAAPLTVYDVTVTVTEDGGDGPAGPPAGFSVDVTD
jgi:hypothetical protein